MEKKGKILIVDDNEDVLLSLNMLLKPYVEGIRVINTPERIIGMMDSFMDAQGWASRELEEAYQILWELRQKQTANGVIKALAEAMDAVERVDDELTEVTL